MPVRSFRDLRVRAVNHAPVRLAVAGGNDEEVMESVVEALSTGLVSIAHITGEASRILGRVPAPLLGLIGCIESGDASDCAAKAVAIVRAGDADVLMKGHVDSTSYLRSIVSRDTGIRRATLLSNITVAEMPSWPKLIAATDNGIVPAPTLEQKRQIILNVRDLYRGLGIDNVKVAVVTATEKISDALPATVDAAALTEESRAGKLPGFTVDGPFGYDVAVSKHAARTKGLDASLVAGDVDLLLFPTIDAANAVAKAWKFHGNADTGSVVLGAKVPVMLNSRSDDAKRRINGLLLAVAMKAGSIRDV